MVTVSCGAAGATDATSRAACVPGGTSETILGALAQTGVAALCPGAVFLADTPIRLSDGQRIFTAGLPTDEPSKALIQVPPGATYDEPVIQDYLATRVEIRNIHIDGNRAVNPYTFSRALIAIAGNGSTLDGVTATNTSGLSAIAAADNPSCAGLRITNNVVADSGFHVGDATWADGIDIRCDDAYVSRNLVRDATDGGISFLGGRNTIIEDNVVVNAQRSAFSGILAADWIGGDLAGSVVRRNTVETCCGQHLHVALSVGVHLWCYDPNPVGNSCEFSSGIAFRDNAVRGMFGFGIVVEGMFDATVEGNNLVMTQWPFQECTVPDQNRYVVNLAHASGSLDPGYAIRKLHWPCLGPTDR